MNRNALEPVYIDRKYFKLLEGHSTCSWVTLYTHILLRSEAKDMLFFGAFRATHQVGTALTGSTLGQVVTLVSQVHRLWSYPNHLSLKDFLPSDWYSLQKVLVRRPTKVLKAKQSTEAELLKVFLRIYLYFVTGFIFSRRDSKGLETLLPILMKFLEVGFLNSICLAIRLSIMIQMGSIS